MTYSLIDNPGLSTLLVVLVGVLDIGGNQVEADQDSLAGEDTVSERRSRRGYAVQTVRE